MKLMIASDIHGSMHYGKMMIEKFLEEKPAKLLLLGDLLYHGPRNELPLGYDPQALFGLLNEYKDSILAVRGNCDAEIDQMVLDFPMMGDYTMIYVDGLVIFMSHGHVYNSQNPPKIGRKDFFVHGHTHLPEAKDTGKYIYLNPGSVSLPKGGNVNSYMIYGDGVFTVKDFEGGVIKSYSAK